MIYVGNGRIHIHVENGEQNEKFMFRKSSGVDTPLNDKYPDPWPGDTIIGTTLPHKTG